MSDSQPASANRAVFLSYASQDAEAARRICEALRASGVEVWFDQNELVGGDAWDQKIRKQIAECALFVPIISAATQARHEGYFRLEWKLAAQRTHMMSGVRAFLLPVVIDETRDAEAHVPEEFRAVQWTRLPGSEAAEKFCARVKKLLGGSELQPGRIRPPEDGEGAASPAKPAVQKSIAVLAFANLSHDPENEYFSDGISEELLNVLAKVPGLRVTARTSSFYFKGKNLPVPEIAYKLGVNYIVEGSVRKSGPRVRITAQLIDAIEDTHLWSETFDRELKDIFALQDEIAGLIAQNLQLKLGAAARATRTVDPESYRLVLEARRAASALSLDGLARAETLLVRALQIDPVFADAHAGLAQLELNRISSSMSNARLAPAALARAERHAREALRLDPAAGEPHVALSEIALVCERVPEAVEEIQRALALCPESESLVTPHLFLLLRTGRPDRMAVAAEKMQALNPCFFLPFDLCGVGHLYGGRYEAALSHLERAQQLGGCPVSYAHHALALALLGRRDEAIARVRMTMDSARARGWPEGLVDHADSHAAWALAVAGASDEAEAIARRLQNGSIGTRWGAGLPLGRLGHVDDAFELLADYPQKYVGFLLSFLHHTPVMRQDPRCEPLLRQLGATEAFETMGRVLRGEKLSS